MDANDFEFWSRFFQAAAENRKQMDALAAWVRQGFKGVEEMNALLMRFYPFASASDEDREAAAARFRESFREMARMWGWVPLEEHREVLKARKELERKVSEQQATIDRLRRMLDDTGSGQADLFQRFQDLMVEQGEQFQQLMQGFTTAVRDETIRDGTKE
ncbi:MAG: hypothetical protein LJE65_00125 [Desulfobacteraceae bacterium]|nr:hypothetical protein [Desulfobacteraceae bacterium]